MHEESLIPNPLGIPADSNQLGNPLVRNRLRALRRVGMRGKTS
jgi:hypothetical protein